MARRPRSHRTLGDGRAGRAGTTDEARERDLVARLRAGDEAAYERLVRVHGPRLLRLARRYVPGEAEDVLQSTWIRVLRSIDGFAGESRLATWLHRIVVNCALMRIRTQSRHPEVASDASALEGACAIDAAGLEELSRRETHASLHEALERLPDTLRAAVLLYDVDGLTLRETSRVLGHSLAAVKTHVHRGHHALRAMLDAARDA